MVGRDRDLDVVLGALDPVAVGTTAMLLEGAPGVGKTALWRYAVDDAQQRGWQTLETAPTISEAHLTFTALSDLLDRHVAAVLPALPPPQREALERALLRWHAGPDDVRTEERMVAMATLSALKILAADSALLVAIDDMQWVDPSSAAALSFALRRLNPERVFLLGTRRVVPGEAESPALGLLPQGQGVLRHRIAPLSIGGEHELLLSRLGLDLSRPTLVRLHEVTQGNPLFALEIGRELIALGQEPPIDEPLPVPGSLRGLVEARLQRLSATGRTVLLAAAALAHPTRVLLEGAHRDSDAGLDEAISAGMVEVSLAGRVRFAHPLYASVVYQMGSLSERRRLHARLSQLVDDAEERARHMALGTVGTDEAVAAELDEAARAASLRGSPHAAAELCDLAARLSPLASDRARRLLTSAEHHRQAGHLDLATERAGEAMRSEALPVTKARALSVLATVTADQEGLEPGLALLHQARREAASLPALRADLHHKLAWSCLVGANVRGARRHAEAMARLARGMGAAAEAAAAATLSHVTVMSGMPVPRDLLERAQSLAAQAAADRPWTWSETSPAALEGVVLLWGGELEEAKIPLEAMLRAALDSGDPWLEMHALAYLSSVDTALGNPKNGLELAQRYLELAEVYGQEAHRSGALWPVGVAQYWLGQTQEARATAETGLSLARRLGQGLYVIGNLSTLGALELSLGHFAPAAEKLLQAWALAERAGVASLGRFPLLADAVEALACAGKVVEAERLSHQLSEIARGLGQPWALALGARSQALVAEAHGSDQQAVDHFERALRFHRRHVREVDVARTELAYGRHQRLAQRKAKARELLEHSLAKFERAEASNWAARAGAELGRIGGRRAAAAGSLSATELAIANLVGAGRSNREIAEELHLSAKTVEWNLSKAYRKLGVRSRTELAAALAGASANDRRTRGASAAGQG